MQSSSAASCEWTDAGSVLSLTGSWLIGDVRTADAFARTLPGSPQAAITIDASQITQMDTAGAYLLCLLQENLSINHTEPSITGLNEKFQSLLTLVTNDLSKIRASTRTIEHHSWVYGLGKMVVSLYGYTQILLSFLGEIFIHFYATILNPIRLQWRSTIHEIDVGGYRALPIIAVMMALIGVVVAYQLGVQLRIYGANIYVVDLSGVAILREFSPLICSVIIAGRTSTSFAAALGTMKVNEEIDALETMGLSPIERLVLPKNIGFIDRIAVVGCMG